MYRSNYSPKDGLNAAAVTILQGLRQSRGMTLQGMADATSLSFPTIQRIFSGNKALSLSELEDLCNALSINPSHVIEDAERAMHSPPPEWELAANDPALYDPRYGDPYEPGREEFP